MAAASGALSHSSLAFSNPWCPWCPCLAPVCGAGGGGALGASWGKERGAQLGPSQSSQQEENLSSPHSLMQHLPAPFFCHQLLAFLLPLHRVPGVLSQPPRVPLPLGFLPSPLSPVGGRGDRNSRPRALALAVSHPAEACVARLSVSASLRNQGGSA
ncbi:hypothetical protein NDU88_005901 [Pleurodeles waltl]|uniref:Secreted protein n=1 Tax=Pleurodeles waltl TaxID=8319 RepID=A0AAV7RPR2_PLEWA|nr:hypothetical protein NDU88_005901 [Pleurodeles waltl]